MFFSDIAYSESPAASRADLRASPYLPAAPCRRMARLGAVRARGFAVATRRAEVTPRLTHGTWSAAPNALDEPSLRPTVAEHRDAVAVVSRLSVVGVEACRPRRARAAERKSHGSDGDPVGPCFHLMFLSPWRFNPKRVT